MNGERSLDLSREEMMHIVLSVLPAHVQTAVLQSLAASGDVADRLTRTVDIASFYLGDEDHRREFLWQYYEQGDSVLFAAVNHIWNSLNGDREHRCALIGALSGTGGTGKAALIATLQQFLGKCLAFNADLPRLAEYPDVETWHRACLEHWEEDATHAKAQCARYSAILDGRKPDALKIPH